MKKQLFALLFTFLFLYGRSQTNLVVDPTDRYQTLEGWGVSLAWWANIAGDWSDAQIDTLCTWLTSPDGLNMNVFRFNIPGEENPTHNHLRYDALTQGYKASALSPYDYRRDTAQRKILLKLKSKRNDCIFEAIAYSPPYWMTNSGCIAGGAGGAENLHSSYFDDFAEYLTDVVKYYHDSLGVVFRTLAPINEPHIPFWQEGELFVGCTYSASGQRNIITEVYNKLQSKNMLGYCTISALDGYDGDSTLVGINDFISNNIMSKISQVNTHSYGSLSSVSPYQQLYDISKSYGKRLWQTETGPSAIPGDGFLNNLRIADVLIRDMRNLKPVAWCDWQYGSPEPLWGLVQYDSNATFTRIPNFYTRMQATRFIKPGYTFIKSSEQNSLAAINPSNDTIVLVINNSSLNDIEYNINLNLFASTGSSAEVYRTSTGMEGAHYGDKTYKVSTYQTITGIANGTYTAKIWVKSSGGQAHCYFQASDYGGGPLNINIPRSVEWVQLTIPNINVTNGQCKISIFSQGDNLRASWCEFDDVQLFLNSAPAVNFVSNPGFENTNVFSQTIPGWNSADSVNADFLQSLSHGNNEECLQLSDIAISNNILSFTANKKSISTLLIPVTEAALNPLSNGNYRISARHSNKVMSVSGWSLLDEAAIVQWDTLGQSNQVFNVQWTSSGYKLLPSYNAKAVSVHGNSMSNGAVIEQFTDSELENQRFSIISLGGGYYKIVAKNSAKCLAVANNSTANGAAIVQWDWLNGNENFQWQFTSVPLESPLPDGTYTIKAKHSAKVMSIADSSSANGAVVEQWDDGCQDNKRFNVTFTSGGYTINPVYNDKLVSINGYSIANGAAAIQWDDLGQSNQLYEIVSLGSGFYKIISRFTNKCLAVYGSGTSNGDDIVQWEWLDNDNFKWSFEDDCSLLARLSPIPDQETEKNIVHIAPNPARYFFNIDYSGIDNAHIQVLDINGKLKFSEKANSNRVVVNVSSYLAKGIYIVKITGTNKTIVRKVVVH